MQWCTRYFVYGGEGGGGGVLIHMKSTWKIFRQLKQTNDSKNNNAILYGYKGEGGGRGGGGDLCQNTLCVRCVFHRLYQ